MNNTEFREICVQEYKERVDRIKAKEKAALIAENQQKDKVLREFLSLGLAHFDVNLDLDAAIKDAAYEGDGFVLTVASKAENFSILAGRACTYCGEVYSFEEVKDFADIGEIIADSPDYICPKCEEAEAEAEELANLEHQAAIKDIF